MTLALITKGMIAPKGGSTIVGEICDPSIAISFEEEINVAVSFDDELEVAVEIEGEIII